MKEISKVKRKSEIILSDESCMLYDVLGAKRVVTKIFLVMLFFVCGSSLYAQQDLQNLIQYALEHSNDVKKAGYKQDEAYYKYRETLGQGLPQIEGSGSYSMMNLGDLTSSLDGMSSMVGEEQAAAIAAMLADWDKLYMSSVGVQVTQLIYSQSYWVGLKTTRKARELYDIMKEQSDEDVISEVANNYYQAGSLIMQLNTLNKSRSNLEDLYKVVELSYKNDMVTETELNRIKVSIVNLKTSIRSVSNAISIQKNYIKALAGLPLDTTIHIDTAYIANDFKLKAEGDFNIEDVTAYKILQKQDEVYKGQVKSAQAEYYPTLAAYFKLNYSNYGTEATLKDYGNNNMVGLNLSIPIFTSGTKHSKVQQYKLQRAQLQEDIEKNKRLLAIDYTSAVSDYYTAAELLNVQKENRELAQKVYDQTLMQYKEGMASLADLLNVNNDFLSADNSYNQQIIKCKTAEVKMLKASGKIKQMVGE